MKNIDEILENLTMNQKKKTENLNCFEKQRLLNRTMDKINSEKPGKRFALKRNVLVCAVCAAFVTSVVVAAGFFKLDKVFYKYLRGSDTNVQVSGENITAKDTWNGITVTAKQIIGDDYGFYAIFDVTGKDNGIKQIALNDAEVEIKGVNVYQCSDIITMQDEKSNSFMLHITSAENLQGKQIDVHLKGRNDKNDSAKWNLNWKADYVNSAKNFEVLKPITIYGGKALWKSVSISPVSVSIKLADLDGTKMHCDNPNDLITVTMDDGSIFSSAYSEDTDILQDTDFITMSFNKIIDTGKVQSISFAGVVYEID